MKKKQYFKFAELPSKLQRQAKAYKIGGQKLDDPTKYKYSVKDGKISGVLDEGLLGDIFNI